MQRLLDVAAFHLVVGVHELLYEERGQTLAEYSLILTVVGVGVVVPTMIIFRTALADTFSAVTACLSGTC